MDTYVSFLQPFNVTLFAIDNNENLKSFVNEYILMKKLDHPNVLAVLGICLESNHESGLPFMVLPFMYNGDLKSYLKKKRKIPACVDHLPEVHILYLYVYEHVYYVICVYIHMCSLFLCVYGFSHLLPL